MSVGGGLSLIRDAVPIEAKRSALVSWGGAGETKYMFTHLLDMIWRLRCNLGPSIMADTSQLGMCLIWCSDPFSDWTGNDEWEW